jgi:hypothetical protein
MFSPVLSKQTITVWGGMKVKFHPFETVSFLGKSACLLGYVGRKVKLVTRHAPKSVAIYSRSYRRLYDVLLRYFRFQGSKQNMLWRTYSYIPCRYMCMAFVRQVTCRDEVCNSARAVKLRRTSFRDDLWCLYFYIRSVL